MSGDAPALTVDELARYPYFDRLPPTVLAKMLPHVRYQDVPTGTLILRRGDYSDAAYFVLSGTVHVRVPVAAAEGRGGDVDLVALSVGEIFGEMGALSRYPITADVVAASPVAQLKIGTPALRLMRKQRALADLKAFIDDRYRSRALVSHLKDVEVFAGLDDASMEVLRQAAELRSFDPGETIIRQGARDDALYLVRGGHVRVAVDAGAAQEPAAVTCLARGEHVGASSVLAGAVWPVTLTALEHVEIVRLAAADLQPVIQAHPDLERRLRRAAAARQAEVDRILAAPSLAEPLDMAMDRGLVNGQSVLLIDLSTCTGCDDCVRACADTHAGRPRFVRAGSTFRHWQIPLACYQCSDPVCMVGCPTGAITRPDGGIAVAIDDASCIGCGNCVTRCPWGNIHTVTTTSSDGREVALATKCDDCHGRPEGPACVQMCPHGSATRISFRDAGTVTRVLGDAAPASRRP